MKLAQPFAFENCAPAQGAPQQEPLASHQSRSGLRGSEEPIRVLIIDDEQEVVDNLADSLKSALFNVKTTITHEAFYGHLAEFEPNIVITDLAMPAHDGIEILRSFRDRQYRGDIVLMSGAEGHVLEAARRMAVSFGLNVTGILRKPFTPKELYALVGLDTGDDASMSTALSERRIRPYFQPKIEIKTGKIVGAEALSRWHHPERGILTPHSYMKTMRSTNRQRVHDFTMLERTAEFCAKLNDIGERMTFAVNFTADAVLSDGFLEVLSDVQQRHNMAPNQIIIELTEEDATENYDLLAERLLKLRLTGAQLSIDDFGTGHSSLSRIQHLPASEIKIDRSFVHGVTEYSDNIAIVRSIIELAHSIHCTVVAEGVETIDTLEILAKIGCDMAQGHLFSPAVNETTFLALVRDNPSIAIGAGEKA